MKSSDADLKLMHRIDKLHMEFPFVGSRMLQGLLVQDGVAGRRLPVATLMKRMGIEALYRKPNTSKPARPCAAWLRHDGTRSYPYLLQNLPVTRPNQSLPRTRSGGWAMDITVRRAIHPQEGSLFLTPMARGFIYFAAVLDWFTRRVLSWRVSITLEAYFCIEAVEDALARHGKPEIFNTDSKSRSISPSFAICSLAAADCPRKS